MLRYLTAYVCTTFIHFPIDVVWVAYLGRDVYRRGMGAILVDQVNIPAALAFYLLYAIGLVIFAVGPALANGSWRTALMWGALFGFFTYGTYDLTNLATLKTFPLSMALIDWAWGTFVSTVSATGGYFVARLVLSRLGDA